MYLYKTHTTTYVAYDKQIHFLSHWLAYNMYLYKTHTTTYVAYDKQIHFLSHWLAYNMYLYKTPQHTSPTINRFISEVID